MFGFGPGPGEIVIALALLVPLMTLYPLPAYVAHSRRHPHFTAILLLNLLAGWTVVGWLASLIWSLGGTARGGQTAAPTHASPGTALARLCPQCGASQAGGNFCSHCGAKLA